MMPLDFRMTNTFFRYYNIYGIFHVGIVLFIIAMLLYSAIARGMDLMTLGVYVAFLLNLTVPATLAQYLTTNVSEGNDGQSKV